MEKQEKAEEEGFSVLPREIIFEILKELPVKSLVRLRCVSKLWCSIIDDPFFVHSHHIRSHSRPGGINIIFGRGLGGGLYKLYSADPEGHQPPYHILNTVGRMKWNPHPVNGLICMDDWIWNPSTHECIDIPPMSITVTLQHERLKLYPAEYFLGYDPSTMKFKVLGRCHITTKRDHGKVDGRIEYKILTLGTNSWRDIVDDSILQQLHVFNRAASTCYIDGVIYSLNYLKSSGDEEVILAFEVGPEKFRVMSLRPDNIHASFLLQVGENLAVMDIRLTTIWILEDYQKQIWNKQSLVTMYKGKKQSLATMYKGKPLIGDHACTLPIGTIHTGEILLLLFATKYIYDVTKFKTPKLFYYDLESKKVRMLNLLKEDSPFLCIKHVESIFRLTGIEGGEYLLTEEEGGEDILTEDEGDGGEDILTEEESESLTFLWEPEADAAPLESWDP